MTLNNLKNMIFNIFKKYLLSISIFLSLITFFGSSIKIYESELCYKYENNIINMYNIEEYNQARRLCPEINYNFSGVVKFYIIFIIFCLIFYIVLNVIFEIKHFFDKYLISATILFVSLSLPVYSFFGRTEFFNILCILILILFLFSYFVSLRINFFYYKTKLRRILYLLFISFYSFFIFACCCVYTLFRCVGGCL